MPPVITPPPMSGVAPPPLGGPGTMPGPAQSAREKVMKSARMLLDAISEEPSLGPQLNPIIERLTKVIRQSVRPDDVPAVGLDGAAGPPRLDRSPTGPPGGDEGGAGNPMALLARMQGGGL